MYSAVAVPKVQCTVSTWPGEEAVLGVRAGVLLWDTQSWTIVGRHQTHHAKVQGLAISPGDARLLSLGGSDDKSLVVWDIQEAR